jgi:predicted protein tyrosine phosphatase
VYVSAWARNDEPSFLRVVHDVALDNITRHGAVISEQTAVMLRLPTCLGAALLWVALATTSAAAQSPRPDPQTTPGATNPAVTQFTISETICQRGWTATVRPPEDITDAIKLQQLQRLGIAGAREAEFEEDHLIPLELGGAPTDPSNLWPEPRRASDGWAASRKDGLERVLNRMVCDGQLTLAEAQQAIAQDWTTAYTKFVALPEQAALARRRLLPFAPASPCTGSPNEFYRSVDGSLVHRPTNAGADCGPVTAICADGTQKLFPPPPGHMLASWRRRGVEVAITMKRILFLCSRNKLRSPTAEQILAARQDLEVASAGLNADAEIPCTAELVEWADLIFVMEKAHRVRLTKRFKRQLGHARIICLDIPDNYTFMQPELISLLRTKLARHLPEPITIEPA